MRQRPLQSGKQVSTRKRESCVPVIYSSVIESWKSTVSYLGVEVDDALELFEQDRPSMR